MTITSLESPIAWYCPRKCETRLSVIGETLDVYFGGSRGLLEGVSCWEEGLDDRPEDPGEVAPRLCFPERRNKYDVCLVARHFARTARIKWKGEKA